MNELTGSDFQRYLNLFVADIDWAPHLATLAQRIKDKQKRYNQAACAILLPYYDKSGLTEPPQNCLLSAHKWHQYPTKNWLEELTQWAHKDAQIAQNRNTLLQLGIIYPLEYNPITRQAFMKLVDCAKTRGDWMSKNADKFKNLVYSYGGVSVCNVFENPQFQNKIDKILNWRSAYFFERLMYDVYKPQELIKIKTAEIARVQRQDPNLIKYVNQERTHQ